MQKRFGAKGEGGARYPVRCKAENRKIAACASDGDFSPGHYSKVCFNMLIR